MTKEEEPDDLEDSSEDEEDAPQVPEVAFDPQLSAGTAKQPDEQFRSKHPLFDAPELIDDKDDLNSPENLSDEGEDDSNGSDKKDGVFEIEAPALQQGGLPEAPTSSHSQGESPQVSESEVPEWKKFTLPATPLPDDTAIDAEIREQFDIAKLLQIIRAG